MAGRSSESQVVKNGMAKKSQGVENKSVDLAFLLPSDWEKQNLKDAASSFSETSRTVSEIPLNLLTH